MSIKINYSFKSGNKVPANLIYFVDEDFSLKRLEKIISSSEFSYISDLLKNSDLKKNFLVFKINSKKTIYLVSIKKNLKTSDIESLGAKFHKYIDYKKDKDYFINLDTINSRIENLAAYFLHGLKLKSYEFNLYKSKNNEKLIFINVIGSKNKITVESIIRFKALEEGIFFARDLVSEPGNILHPDEYAKRISGLKKNGLKINIYDEKKLKKLGMNALLGVGQGSIRGSYLVTMEWNGLKNSSKPVAFVGKGVCFDTGGISLKPAKFMEDMTYDMAGSATVVGLMKSLALRKAKVNAVGVVGLVENMPGGNAQRPGDIVKSYSGKTIEILNTDAEGRLVLADALTYIEKNLKPTKIIDIATLTGAVIVALGDYVAGMSGTDSKMISALKEAGENTHERVWELPLYKDYISEVKSDTADFNNINYGRSAGCIMGAAFLSKFVEKTPWTHLDIAGTSWLDKPRDYYQKGATGFGVRLLIEYLKNN